jgi:quinol monooxygenase YgiN
MAEASASSIVSLVVTMTVKPEQEAAFLAMTSDFIRWVHANEPGTLLYVLNRKADAEHTFTWVERYQDEAALQAHLTSEELAKARARLSDMLAEPPTRMRLHQVLPP